MEAEAAQVREEEGALQAELDAARAELAEVVATRQDLEGRLADAERAVVAAVRAVADRREGLARLAGQVNALRTRATSGREESARLAAAAADARERATQAEAELARVQAEVGLLDAGELGLDDRHENAVAAYEAIEARVRELAEGEREAEREQSTWTARADALVVGLTRKDGTAALLAAGARLPGVLGSVAALLTVEPGYETAVAAALGAAADAVAVASSTDAVSALELLKSDDGGRAGLLVGDPAAGVLDAAPSTTLALPTGAPLGARGGAGAARAAGRRRPAPSTTSSIVADLPAAASLVADHPEVRAVTRDGDVLGAHWSAGGSASQPTAIEISAAVDEARQKADEAAGRHERLHAELSRGPRTRRRAAGRGRDRAGGAARVRREALGRGRAAGPARPGGPLGRRRGGPPRRGARAPSTPHATATSPDWPSWRSGCELAEARARRAGRAGHRRARRAAEPRSARPGRPRWRRG